MPHACKKMSEVVGFVLLSSCAVLNVVMGVVCDGVLELAAAKPSKLAEEQEKELEALRLEAGIVVLHMYTVYNIVMLYLYHTYIYIQDYS